MGGPLRREGLEGRAVVRLGLARHRLPRRHLLVRRHLRTGELAFHYCYVPEGQLLTKTRLIRAAGLRWPVRRDSSSARTARPGPVPGPALHRDPAPPRAGHGRPGGLRGHRRPAQGPHRHPGTAPGHPGQAPPSDPGLIPLTIHEVKRLLAAVLARPHPAPAALGCNGRTPPPGPSTLVPPAPDTAESGNTPWSASKCGCRTSEAPPLTAEIRGSAGVSLQVGALWPSQGRLLLVVK